MDRQETNRSINAPMPHLADNLEQIIATIGGSQAQQYHAKKGSGISPGDITEIILRRRWIIIIPFLPYHARGLLTGTVSSKDLPLQHDDIGATPKSAHRLCPLLGFQ